MIFIFIEPTCKRGLTLAVDGWVGTARRAHNRLKDDIELHISVGGIQVIRLQRDTLKPQTMIQQNAVIGTVAVDGWVVTFGTARGLKDDTLKQLLTY